MKNYRLLIISLCFLALGCTKDKLEVLPNLEVNDFIWKGLNSYYLWQDQVGNLSDVRFLNNKEYQLFLSSESNPAAFFEQLLYQRGTVDKWSWIVSDYIALEQALQGTTKTTGMEFGLVRFKSNASKLFGYVRYVLPNTAAATKKITRGMLFNKVNNTQLTPDNYRRLLFSPNGFNIHLANYNNGDPVTNGTVIALDKAVHQENPVFITKTFTEGSKKIGYLMYNSFTRNFDTQLNAAFARLKGDAITDLIVDLRYNGGGSVQTAVYLASMITGQFNGQLFAKQRWNRKASAKINPSRLNNNFTDQIHTGNGTQAIESLRLPKVYFITTGSSASASELVINGLDAYIDVQLIGTKTHGKYAGSITLYDSQNFSKVNVNPSHKWAMQPIVLQIVNKNGTNDKDGFDPDISLKEDYNNLGVLGEKSDPLLNRTIQYIVTGARGQLQPKTFELQEISNSKLELPTSNNMYIDLE